MTKPIISEDLLNPSEETMRPFIKDACYLIENFSPHKWRNDPDAYDFQTRVRWISYCLYRKSLSLTGNTDETRIIRVADFLEITPDQLLNGAKLPPSFWSIET